MRSTATEPHQPASTVERPWVFGDDPVDAVMLAEATGESGAVVMGRNLFDVVDGPGGWNDDMGYGAHHAAQPPFFVVTHHAPAATRLGLDFTFVEQGVGAAIDAARKACPSDKSVIVMGGGDVVRQAVDHGLADELRIHLSPVLMGSGTPLFGKVSRRELRQVDARVSSYATHLTYAVGR